MFLRSEPCERLGQAPAQKRDGRVMTATHCPAKRCSVPQGVNRIRTRAVREQHRKQLNIIVERGLMERLAMAVMRTAPVRICAGGERHPHRLGAIVDDGKVERFIDLRLRCAFQQIGKLFGAAAIGAVSSNPPFNKYSTASVSQ